MWVWLEKELSEDRRQRTTATLTTLRAKLTGLNHLVLPRTVPLIGPSVSNAQMQWRVRYSSFSGYVPSNV